jgi:hypothetical protein
LVIGVNVNGGRLRMKIRINDTVINTDHMIKAKVTGNYLHVYYKLPDGKLDDTFKFNTYAEAKNELKKLESNGDPDWDSDPLPFWKTEIRGI